MAAGVLENVVVHGDLSKLSPAQRLDYYARVCSSVGLNPLTRPFQYITLNGKLTLYAARDATDQIRDKKSISVRITARERHEDIYVVTAQATTPEGRSDESIGAVTIAGLKGEALANALMKAETKAKRRVTLSIGGLGWLDETEVSTVPDAAPVTVNMDTGEIVGGTTVAQIASPKDDPLVGEHDPIWKRYAAVRDELMSLQPSADWTPEALEALQPALRLEPSQPKSVVVAAGQALKAALERAMANA